MTHRRPTHLVLIGSLTLLTLAMTACEKDDVRSYTVEKSKTPTPAVVPDTSGAATPVAPVATGEPASGAGARMLGAIATVGDRTWYFKMLGPVDQVEGHAKQFDEWLTGLEFTGDAESPIKFNKVPDAWKQVPGGGMRYATFVVGDHEPPLQLTVIPLGAASGSLKDNVDRWRNQVGLGAASDDDMAKTTRTIDVGGNEVTVVDLTGPGIAANIPGRTAPGAGPVIPPFLARPTDPAPTPTPESSADANDPIQYKLPQGWSKMTDLPPMATMAFSVDQDGEKLITTVTKLGGPAGGVDANIARWAGQVQGNAESAAIVVDGHEGVFAIIAGEKEMILGVIVPVGDASWFFKLKGPIDAVAAQKPGFDALIKSIRFGGGA